MKVADRSQDIGDRVTEAIRVGMMHAVWAREQPHRVAVYELNGRTRTFRALNANANRVARLLRGAGLRPGDCRGAGLHQPRRVLRGAVRRACAPACGSRR